LNSIFNDDPLGLSKKLKIINKREIPRCTHLENLRINIRINIEDDIENPMERRLQDSAKLKRKHPSSDGKKRKRQTPGDSRVKKSCSSNLSLLE